MTYVQRKDGTIYDLEQYGIRTKDFIVSAPSLRHVTEEIEGRDGVVDIETTEGARNITCVFRVQAEEYAKFPDARNQVFKLFRSKESFYLIDRREPNKRWEVKVQDAYELEQKYQYGDFTIDFICYKGYAESIKPTSYTFTTPTFRVFNAGDIDIDPRVLPLTITFTGSSTNLTITNTTTGDTWQYTGTTVDGDTITLDGVRSLKNGASIFGNTNRQLITIAPGWNDFSVVGTTGAFEISFNFHFYYL
jgi:predicted phage tail component-like protein